MNKDKKIPVYLTEIDWQAVLVCLLVHVESRPPALGETVWTVGRNRLRYIADEIASKLPKRAADQPDGAL